LEDIRENFADIIPFYGEIWLEIREVRVKIGETWYTVEVDDSTGSPTSVTVEGQTYSVEIDNTVEPKSSYKSESKSGQASSAHSYRPIHTNLSKDGVVTTPMAGKVLAIKVKPGDVVAEGEELCVVEAMKMEQSIRSPRDGKVKTVHVKPMEQVTINAKLVELL
jgi:biotin carboxyl carrier protein